jgi:transposase
MKTEHKDFRKNSILKTREKRKSQDCKVYELKIDQSHLSKEKLNYLNMLFLETKWLYNSIIASEDIFKFNDKTKSVIILNKDREEEERELNHLSSQMKQEIKNRTIGSTKSLSTKKKKNKNKKKSKNNKIGKLKFKGRVNSIPLKQFGKTHRFLGPNYLKLQGFNKPFKILGFKQIPKNAEFANATLIRKASGFYLKVTCYVPKEEKIFEEEAIGIDFGIKTSLTLSNEEKIDVNFPVSKKTRKLQRQIKRKKNGSNNKYKHQKKINRSIERTTNQKKDKRNKIVSNIVNKFEIVVVQNESIKAWHSGRFGKKVQSSSIGGIMSDLKKKSHTSVVVDKYFPSTKMCPECGTLNNPSLSDRIYKCDCGYSMDRDVHSARNILKEGLKMIGRGPINTMPVEELSDSSLVLRTEEELLLVKQEAQGFSLG